MKRNLFFGAILGTALLAFAAKDPVVMKINGKEIKLSEFEYLYKKNNKQQIEKETLEKYIDRFVTYKLKVEEAEEMGLDTLASFTNEYNGYKMDLAKPYLEDKSIKDSLVAECYNHMQRNVDISNIFVTLGKDDVQKEAKKHKIDSLYECLQKGENIERLAFEFSEDRAAKRNNGRMGYIRVGMVPYAFQRVAFSTPVGEHSAPFQSQFGWHILKVNAEKPEQGKVLVEHILKLYPQNADEAAKQATYDKVKAIYDQVTTGADFETVARKESEDPGSAANGGKLPWFGTGEMVKEFEKVSYELADNEISKPFATMYGVHIVKKLASKPIGNLAENEKAINQMISQDERGSMAKDAKMQELKARYKYVENSNLEAYVDKLIETADGNDSIFVESLHQSNIEAFKIGKAKVMLNEATSKIKPRKTASKQGEKMAVLNAVSESAEKALSELYIKDVYNTDANFHNLLDEYHDGMLLFEISNRKIWEGAAKDEKGLENYFNTHKSQYTWTEPKFKGVIVLAVNDSIMQAAKDFLEKEANNSNKFADLKAKYKKQVNTEAVVAGKGDNPRVDYEIFKTGEKPNSKRYASSFIYEGKMLDAPEDYSDVKVQVVSDYQTQLENEWIAALKKKYKVEINKKELKNIKEQ